VRRSTLTVVSLLSLVSFALLASLVAHDHVRYHFPPVYHFEPPLLRPVRSPSPTRAWADLAELIAAPAVVAILAVAFTFGILRRSLVRLAVYTGFGVVAFLASEYVSKPFVHETYAGVLSFPSGNVTAACATTVAIWLALYPLLARWAQAVTLLLGAAWVLLMSVAVVNAHWHTPLDALGSVLLSLGVVTAGGALYERDVPRGPDASPDGDTAPPATEDDPALRSEVRGRS
jgi:hypothetical protein